MPKYVCWLIVSVFQEQATDILLTLGQAFELAYQMALRDQVTSKNKSNHKAAVSPRAVPSQARDFKDVPSTTVTSSDLKSNGNPLKMRSLTLSLASEPVTELQRTPTEVSYSDNDG